MLSSNDIVLKIVFRNCVVKLHRNGDKSISRIRKQPDPSDLFVDKEYKFSNGELAKFTPSNWEEECTADKIDAAVEALQNIFNYLNNLDSHRSSLENDD